LARSLDFTSNTVEESPIEATAFSFNINAVSHHICCVTPVDRGKVACAYFTSAEKFTVPAPTYNVLNGKAGKRKCADPTVGSSAGMTCNTMELNR
jgi:hypothetical protein